MPKRASTADRATRAKARTPRLAGQTDWERVRNTTDEEIGLCAGAAGEGHEAESWAVKGPERGDPRARLEHKQAEVKAEWHDPCFTAGP